MPTKFVSLEVGGITSFITVFFQKLAKIVERVIRESFGQTKYRLGSIDCTKRDNPYGSVSNLFLDFSHRIHNSSINEIQTLKQMIFSAKGELSVKTKSP